MKNLLLSLLFVGASLSGLFAYTLAELPPQLLEIDLELQMDSPSAAPIYSNYSVTLTLINKGPATATDVAVRYAKPAGVVYAGGNEHNATIGTFYPYDNEHWTVSSLDSGAIATLTVNYFLLQNDLPVAYAEVISANEPDIDSTPDNGTLPNVNEDDEASSDALVICSGDVFLESQADVDAFAGCNIIHGNLIIQSPNGANGASSDIYDLSPLLSLTEVTGAISFINNDLVVDLHGLENLNSIKRLAFVNNDLLTDIQALSGLNGIIENIFFFDNPSLSNIDGLEGIIGLSGSLEIDGNNSLKNVNGLSGIVDVAGFFEIDDNVALKDISGLNNLTTVTGSFILALNDSLATLDGLNKLDSVGRFIIAGNEILHDVSGAESLSYVENELFLGGSPLLEDCCIFLDLLNNNGVGGTVTIENNAGNCNSPADILTYCVPNICNGDVLLTTQGDVDNFAGCTVIEGDLFIQSPNGSTGASSDIVDLSPLLTLTEVAGYIVIVNNDQLLNLNGLNNIVKCNGLAIVECENIVEINALSGISGTIDYITLIGNVSLLNIDGLTGVTNTIMGVFLEKNIALQNLNGFSNLTSVATSLQYGFNFYDNNSLVDLSGLNNLKEVGGNFAFNRNVSLQSLNGLQNLETVKGDLVIVENDVLNDVSALNSLNSVEEGLNVLNNPLLEDCCIFFDLLNNNGVGGTVTIENNAGLCNSLTDIVQNCDPSICNGDVFLATQADVDAFAGCSVVNGLLKIGIVGTGSDIHDLSPLLSVTEVNGSLVVEDNDSLLDLNGLNNVKHVERLVFVLNENLENIQALSSLAGEIGDLFIFNNDALKNLDGLEGLTGLSGSFELSNNLQIENIDGLSGLEYIKSYAWIYETPSLVSIAGFENLTSVGDVNDPTFGNHLAITDCNALQNLDGLDNLVSAGIFVITRNDVLQDVSSVKSLGQIGGDFIVSKNPLLEDCCIFYDLLNSNGVGGEVIIEDNAGLCNSLTDIVQNCDPSICNGDVFLATQADVDAFAGCSVVNGLLKIGIVGTGSDIHDLSPLLSVTEVNGSLIVEDSDSLLDLQGLNNIAHVERLLIIFNDNLENVQALSSLTGEIDELWFWDNASLKNLDGLEGITGLSQSFELSGNLELEDIDGLSGLGYVRENAWFFDNPSLISIAGLKNLTSVGDVTDPSSLNSLTIADCNALQSLDGLDNLATAAKFVITRNGMLQDVSSVKSLEQVREIFLISKNPLLEDCCIFYDLLNNDGVEGTVTVENNAGLCNSPTDILDNCQPLGTDLELTMNSPTSADIYTTYPVELTVINTGGIPATGIQIEFSKPAGVVYAGGNPFSLSAGSFSAYGNQIWTINNLEANASATLTVNYFLLQNDLPTAYAQVVAANEEDEDSTPDNGTPPLVNEDDEASSGLGGQVICIGDVILESQEDVDNFPGCTIIDGMLRISTPPGASTSDITDLSPLASLTKVTGSIIIEFQDKIKDLHGMENIAQANRLVVVLSDSLKTLQGLSGINGVMEEILIMDNLALENIDGLEGITSLSNGLLILNNTLLKNIDGLSNLTGVGIGGTMSNSKVQITSNPSLTDVSGLRKLGEVREDFILAQNDSLQSVNGLESLKKVGKFIMSGNDLLEDVSALFSLENVETDFIMSGNPLLENCCVFYDLINNNGVGGTYILVDNAGNCNSPTDIVNNCIPTGDIDLSLTMSTPNADPAIYTSVPVSLTITNDGPLTATAISISFPKPSGTVYTGGNEYTLTQGSFNTFNNEMWNVGDLSAGGSASITVNYFLLNENTMTPYAQVISHNEQDVDSTPDNGNCCTPAEDDEAALTLNGFQPGSNLQLTTRQNRHRLSIDQVYPNPTKYWITLDIYAHESGIVLFDFYNATGQSMHQMEMNLDKGQNEVRVDVSEWRSGTYTIIGRGLGHPAYGRFLKVWE